MNFLRILLASLMSLICTLAVSAYVTFQTLESTVLNKQEVKTWFADSNAYDTLFPTLVSADQTVEQQTQNASSSLITKETIQTALNQTFTTTYVQSQAEKVLDNTYSWINGSSQSITFNINTTEKKQDFITNLSALLQPKLQKLPQCASYSQFDSLEPTCLPPGTTAAQAAKLLATDAANSTTFFTQPITNETVEQANQTSGSNASQSPLTNSTATQNQLPQVVQTIRSWGVWLPLIAIVSGGLCIVLSRNRFKASKHLAGRLSVGLGLTALLGLAVAYFGKEVSIANYASGALATNVFEPVLRQALPAIGIQLAWVSGSLSIGLGIIWVVLQVIKKRRSKAQLLAAPTEVPPQQPPASPTAPSVVPPQNTPRQTPGEHLDK